jgi:formamidopyrimidine-DNA glycosylase
MPELPEVETIVRGLREKILGRRIRQVRVFKAKVVINSNLNLFLEKLKNRVVKAIERRGKAIIIQVGQSDYLLIHLGMTGRLIFYPETAPIDKHTHVQFAFLPDGQLIYHDLRQFGHLQLYERIDIGQIPFVKKLGPEPIAQDFTAHSLSLILNESRRSIKDFLLDQRRIAGLGNIYASEALFLAGIDPQRIANQLQEVEIKRLHRAMRRVLLTAIEHRGTSFSDYLDAEGKEGKYNPFLKVYRREGQACFRCRNAIVRIKTSNRSTYYCPTCQQ